MNEIQSSNLAGNSQPGFKDGDAQEAMFDHPWGICISVEGNVYISDQTNNKIRLIRENAVSTIAGNGQKGFQDGADAQFSFPNALCTLQSKIYVSDQQNHRIRVIEDNSVHTFAGTGQRGFLDGEAQSAMFSFPHGICITNEGKLFVCDQGNHRIRMVDNGQVTTIAGNGLEGHVDGPATEAQFYHPHGIFISQNSNLYVTDSLDQRIRMVQDGVVTTLAGTGHKGSQDGACFEATFCKPTAIISCEDGTIFVADFGNNCVRILRKGQVETLPVTFRNPTGMSLSNGRLYVVEYGNHTIKVVDIPLVKNMSFSLEEPKLCSALSSVQ